MFPFPFYLLLGSTILTSKPTEFSYKFLFVYLLLLLKYTAYLHIFLGREGTG
jgi:hypothetical protein